MSIENLQRKIDNLENIVDFQIIKNRQQVNNQGCDLIEAILNLQQCSLVVNKHLKESITNFDKCNVNAKDINGVINCVETYNNDLNNVMNSNYCKLNLDCKYSLSDKNAWKAGCLAASNNMNQLVSCIKKLNPDSKTPLINTLLPNKSKNKGKGKGKGKGKSKSKGKGKNKGKGKQKNNENISNKQSNIQSENATIKKLHKQIKKLKNKKDGSTIILPTSGGVSSLNTAQLAENPGFHPT